jgi:hypothetical protein
MNEEVSNQKKKNAFTALVKRQGMVGMCWKLPKPMPSSLVP